ncbi:TolC family outer membrane protein [Ensifer adhaerens]|uniref:TolC family outer membrane protein n=1 Tax=Ensifer adhaerens TaxID=106592 RepID=UPI000CF03ECA|nr:TolC family outer membrane protein [Ensifer adhaerens]
MKRILVALVAMIAPIAVGQAHAEPLSSALAKAYRYNPTLNASRAGVRASAYDIDIARSAMLPKIAWRNGIGYDSSAATNRGTFGILLDQTLFDGLRTTNNVEVNKARQRASEENTRNTEQNILFEATEAYMDVVLARRIVTLRKQDLDFLKALTRSEIARHAAGERTRTNIAQAEARRAAAQAALSLAHAEVKRAQATYRQIIGDEPGKLTGGKVPSKMLPANLDRALAIAASQHPALLAKRHLAEGAMFNVAVSEGKLLPTVTGAIGVGRGEGGSAIEAMRFDGSATARKAGIEVKVPVYQGGKAAAEVRQSKENLGNAHFTVDVQHAEVQAKAASAWAQYQAALATASASRAAVKAATMAKDGMMEEQAIGQRTLLDVLEAQADVVKAQVRLANAERDTVVGGYRILSAIGKLGAKDLGLVARRTDAEGR